MPALDTESHRRCVGYYMDTHGLLCQHTINNSPLNLAWCFISHPCYESQFDSHLPNVLMSRSFWLAIPRSVPTSPRKR
eukprot:3725473-Rhodomonas_salina.6